MRTQTEQRLRNSLRCVTALLIVHGIDNVKIHGHEPSQVLLETIEEAHELLNE